MKSDFLKALFITGLALIFALIVLIIVGQRIISIEAQEIPPIVITEIMYDLDGSDTNREWVEIYNRGNQAVEIIGGSVANSWRFNDGSNHTLTLVQGDLTLQPQEAAIIASDAATFLTEHPAFSGTVIDTVMSLNNAGDIAALSADAGQTFFTQVNYSSSWGGAGNGKTLEKIDLAGDDGQNNWQESNPAGGTPGAISQSQPPVINPPAENHPPVAEAGANQTALVNQPVNFNGSSSGDPDGDMLTYAWHLGDGNLIQGESVSHAYATAGTYFVILEVSDGVLSATDTLEIFIQDNQPAPTSTNPIPEPEINPEPAGNHAPMAEAGEDRQALINQTVNFDGSNSFDPDNNQLTYLWDFGDGQVASGTAVNHQYVLANTYTVILTVSDGELSDQDSILVEVVNNVPVSGPSAGASGSPVVAPPVYSDKIIINEILPNPKGSDEEAEFIELYNAGYASVDLAGWQLQDNSSRVYTIVESDFSSTAISPGGYFVINRKISNISLNNTGGDKVILYQPNGNQLQVVEYSSSALEGKAYARKSNNEWAWTLEITSGQENVFAVNLPPQASISVKSTRFFVDEPIDFDGSLSKDPDAGQLSYLWEFGDQTTADETKESHVFETAGVYNVVLTVKDQGNLTDSTTKKITITAPAASQSVSADLLTEVADYSVFINTPNVIISEFLPNPAGSDEQEWIELYNNSSAKVDLSALMIDDAEGGSEPLTLKDYFIEPLSYLLINRADSKIALNNSADSVRLLSIGGQLIQEISYSGAKEGKSYGFNRLLNSWFWVDTPTPGLENQLMFGNNLQVAGLYSEEPFQQEYSIAEIKDLDKGTKVNVQGVVTAAPGILGKRVFYLAGVDWENKICLAAAGLEIYSSTLELPLLAQGDVVEFSGKVSEVQGKKRINLQKDSQINVLDHWELPAPEVLAIGDITDDLLGALISVTGVFLEKKSSTYYLDDGSGEIAVYFKTSANIKKPEIKSGELMSATGILDLTAAGWRLLPRSSADVQWGKVLGQSAPADEVINMENAARPKTAGKYLLFGGGGVLVLLATILLKSFIQHHFL